MKRTVHWFGRGAGFSVCALALAASAGAQTLRTNLALSTNGGSVERITDQAVPGPVGNRLIDGNSETVWQASAAKTPHEIVLSFFNRQSALVSGVRLVTTGTKDRQPSRVEVWVSRDGANGIFSRVVEAALKDDAVQPELAFKPINATFVKVVIAETRSGGPAELAEVEVLEASTPGYKAMAVRHPAMRDWSQRPRYIAQRGVDWLESAALDWQRQQKCFGCHIQGQVITGLAIAKRNGYRVSDAALGELVSLTRKVQHSDGSFHTTAFVTATQFAALAMAHADDVSTTRTPELIKAVDYLLAKQTPAGEVPIDHHEPPIDQGSLMATTNASISFDQAYRNTGDSKYREAAEKALSWIAAGSPKTTQDRAFQIIGLARFGSIERRQVVNAAVDQLKANQRPDGGWAEIEMASGSNAYATGQVLYALKVAGLSVDSLEFRRGVEYLRATQLADGSWPLTNTQSGRPSALAATMWGVIGLGGSFKESKFGSLQVISRFEASPTPRTMRNILVILDSSGSMNRRLGTSTRIATAQQALKRALDQIPQDYNVGLRLYAHRAASGSKDTCTDTELVVPVAPLDRARIANAAETARPRGDTPLVYSMLQGAADLKSAGGGALIVITDGGETCGGEWRTLATQVKEAGIGISLNIVGFGLESATSVAQLRSLARSAGGQYLNARDGNALLQSLSVAAARYPYTVVDSRGRAVATNMTDGSAIELPPGTYSVIVHAGGRQVSSGPLRVAASQDSVLTLTGKPGRLALVR